MSSRAVTACKGALAKLLPSKRFDVQKADFLTKTSGSIAGPAAVVMNPPFSGYGSLNKITRRRIVSLLDMKGRFNLGYAFVCHAVALYKPTELVALLPSNWIYSRRSAFRTELDALNGTWEWDHVGDDAFTSVSVDVGILLWKPKEPRPAKGLRRNLATPRRTDGFEVRQGVATGLDASFVVIAERPPQQGTVMLSVRGRDVGRSSCRPIWVPPSNQRLLVKEFEAQVDSSIVTSLRARTCVTSGRRRVYEYHEPAQDWFAAKPKLILPEIIIGRVRIEVDERGTKLPPLYNLSSIPECQRGEGTSTVLEKSPQPKGNAC